MMGDLATAHTEPDVEAGSLFAWLGEYERRNWVIVPVPGGEKQPAVKGWNIKNFAVDNFAPGMNVAVRLGEHSGGLVDIDLDCIEAIELAPLYLPPTDAVFGRASKPQSHRLYVAQGAVFGSFHDPLFKGKNTLLELRSNG